MHSLACARVERARTRYEPQKRAYLDTNVQRDELLRGRTNTRSGELHDQIENWKMNYDARV